MEECVETKTESEKQSGKERRMEGAGRRECSDSETVAVAFLEGLQNL